MFQTGIMLHVIYGNLRLVTNDHTYQVGMMLSAILVTYIVLSPPLVFVSVPG